MSRPTTIPTSTHQMRVRIRTALKEAGLGKAFVTDEHAAALSAAGLAPAYGMPMKQFLHGISGPAASRFLSALRKHGNH